MTEDTQVNINGSIVRLGDLQPFQLRMVEEQFDVRERLTKLTVYMKKDKADIIQDVSTYSIDPLEYYKALTTQMASMAVYLGSLIDQMKNWDLSDIAIQKDDQVEAPVEEADDGIQ